MDERMCQLPRGATRKMPRRTIPASLNAPRAFGAPITALPSVPPKAKKARSPKRARIKAMAPSHRFHLRRARAEAISPSDWLHLRRNSGTPRRATIIPKNTIATATTISPAPNVPIRAPQAVLKPETTGELKENSSATKMIKSKIHLTGREKKKPKKRLMGEGLPLIAARGVPPDVLRGFPLAFANSLPLEHR